MSDQIDLEKLKELRAAIHRGQPMIEFFIEPPLQAKLVNNRICLDAKCMEIPGITKEGIARFSFSAEVAMFLLELLQRIDFTVSPESPTGD
ncbi:hypothetical protein [Pseudomonas denitrificans (nom. rej.)]|uniref:Uncharacterized protein n=1 Tax=Pseudomonas denitrificans TaxID=43306 RepID=A0A9X7MYJ9_PSEDE|nr:hypothetical protein [Pseudomonas denitrificans (nom. rej.)]QEY71714.1 hypothetical protein F1C79_08780 [Pseudomonas denitrificans (nom. rej.)]